MSSGVDTGVLTRPAVDPLLPGRGPNTGRMYVPRDTGRMPVPRGGGGTAAAHSDFAAVLGKMGRTSGETDEQLARRSAEQFVAMSFVQPLLKELRASDHTAAPFARTDGEKQFQGLMDAEMAQRIVRTSNFPVVERIASDLLKKSRGGAGEVQTKMEGA